MLQTLSILPIICFKFLREKPKLAFQEKTQRSIFCKDSKEFFKMEARKNIFPVLTIYIMNSTDQGFKVRRGGGWGEKD